MASRFHIRLPDPGRARAAGTFAFRGNSAEAVARELEDALRSDVLFERWRATQDDPDAVDPGLGATDPGATVHGEQHDLHIDLKVDTSLSGQLLRERMRLLAGSAWELRDVSGT